MKEKTESTANIPNESQSNPAQPVNANESGAWDNSHGNDNNDAYTDEYDNYSPWG